MFNVNRVTLLGHVTHDPQARAAKTGLSITSLSLATNYSKKGSDGKYVEEPEFHQLVCFGKTADLCAKSVKKGVPLYAEGRLKTNKYKNKEGNDVSKTEIVVDRLVLLSSKKGSAVEAEA